MTKFWVRLYRDNRLLADAVCDAPVRCSPARLLEDGLRECCRQLDLANPMILKKHVEDMRTYSLTRFLPADFPENVSFDRMEVTVFDDSPKHRSV